MAKYTSSASDGGQTVALSISNSSLHVSCSMNGDSAALSLEVNASMSSFPLDAKQRGRVDLASWPFIHLMIFVRLFYFNIQLSANYSVYHSVY